MSPCSFSTAITITRVHPLFMYISKTQNFKGMFIFKDGRAIIKIIQKKSRGYTYANKYKICFYCMILHKPFSILNGGESSFTNLANHPNKIVNFSFQSSSSFLKGYLTDKKNSFLKSKFNNFIQ